MKHTDRIFFLSETVFKATECQNKVTWNAIFKEKACKAERDDLFFTFPFDKQNMKYLDVHWILQLCVYNFQTYKQCLQIF